MNPERSEREELFYRLDELARDLSEFAHRPENRARRLSLAVTNVEQGALWMRDHLIHDPVTTVGFQEPK